MSGLSITSSAHDEALVGLPWDTPLTEWPAGIVAGLPRGISRHEVRFIHLRDAVIAVKETRSHIALREYEILKALRSLQVPCVEPLGYVTGRQGKNGERLDSVLLTVHLKYSLPYRALYSHHMDQSVAGRLVDALAVLLVKLHLVGFYWGDVSLSNTLFRRDADEFAAYLVDAETGELHDRLSDGQRHNDLQLAHVNIAGEFMDLQAGGFIDAEVDPLEVSNRLRGRYLDLWTEITRVDSFGFDEQWRMDERIRGLNELGFDVGELSVTTDIDGVTAQIEPKVVEPDYHSRRLKRLTGLDAYENQARRILTDIDHFRAATAEPEESEQDVSRRYLATIFNPIVHAVPQEWRGKLETAQIFHEFLEHRWLLSEREQRDVADSEAVRSYLESVLSKRRDEASFIRSADERAEEP